jgi:glycosyltransferase involved in cell wall biosynthesis
MAQQQIKNLLFVLPALNTGGSEHVVFDIAKRLPKNRYRPVVFSILKGPLEAKLKKAGIETIVSKKRKGKGHIELALDVYRTIRQYQIDIVLPHHFVSLFYSFWGTKLKPSTKLIFTEHAAMEIAALPFHFRVLAIVFLAMSTGCIAISKQIAECYQKSLKVSPSKIFHIPNGIDLTKFAPLTDKSIKRKTLGISKGDWVIGTIANLTEVKNHKNLLLAFQKVLQKWNNITLVLAGSGPLENTIKALSNHLQIADNILFLGQRSDVAEIYGALDICCLPSVSEGFPLSILEAMACKIPLVATDVSGINEIIQSGQNGLLVPSNDPEQLAGAIIAMLQDEGLRDRLGKCGYETVCARYSLDRWICRYDELFSKLSH